MPKTTAEGRISRPRTVTDDSLTETSVLLIDHSTAVDAVELDLLIDRTLELGGIDPVVAVVTPHAVVVGHRHVDAVPGLDGVLTFERRRIDPLPPSDLQVVLVPVDQQVLLSGGEDAAGLHIQVVVHDVEPVTANIGERVALLGPREDLGTDLQGFLKVPWGPFRAPMDHIRLFRCCWWRWWCPAAGPWR